MGELAQVQHIGLAGQAAAASKEPGEGEPFGSGEGSWIVASAVDWAAAVTGHLPARLEPGTLGQSRSQRRAETQRKPPSLVTLTASVAAAVMGLVVEAMQNIEPRATGPAHR